MRSTHLLGAALALAALVAACGADDESAATTTRRKKATSTGDTGAQVQDVGGTAPVATNSPAGKAFYKASVHPILQKMCGQCHAAGPGPAWFTPSDSEKSYTQLFSQGFVINQSHIVTKGPHGGVTTNVLDNDQTTTWNKWVAMELKDGGQASPPNILAKLGTCFDKGKFDAMKMGEWRTTARNGDNNVNNIQPENKLWDEDTDTCTGCNNTECSSCHLSDGGATNFFNAENSPLPPGTTFENTKLATPAYITKFFGVSPDGKPIASNAIQMKSDSVKLQHAYAHPLFNLTDAQKAGVNAFVGDVITRFNAGSCGK